MCVAESFLFIHLNFLFLCNNHRIEPDCACEDFIAQKKGESTESNSSD